jgi:hypothetical protein
LNQEVVFVRLVLKALVKGFSALERHTMALKKKKTFLTSWPDPNNLGIPEEPKKGHMHWFQWDGGYKPLWWDPILYLYFDNTGRRYTTAELSQSDLFTYCGKALTPVEVDSLCLKAMQQGLTASQKNLEAANH